MVVKQYWSATFDPATEAAGEPVLAQFIAMLSQEPGELLPVQAAALHSPGASLSCKTPFIRYACQFDIQHDRMIGRYDAWMATDKARQLRGHGSRI